MVDVDYIIHFGFISAIVFLLIGLFGAQFKKFGEKHYKIRKRYLPFLIFPRTERNYAIAYRLLIVFMLVFMVLFYVLFLLFNSS